MRTNMKLKIDEILEKRLTYEFCRRAYTGISFSEEKRADMERESFEKNIFIMFDAHYGKVTEDNKEAFLALFDKFIDGYTNRYIDRLSALSRCVSTMIAGRGNFPVARANKASVSERKKSDAQSDYWEYMDKKIAKTVKPKEKSTTEQLAEAKEDHRVSLEFNKILRNKKSREEKLLMAKDVTESVKDLKDFIWTLDNGHKFHTTNTNARVKRLEAKLKKEETFKSLENKTQEFDGFKVVFNYEIERYQIVFDEIPTEDTRKFLKSKAFRWSPKNEAWQVHLNNNGRYKLGLFIKYFKEVKGE